MSTNLAPRARGQAEHLTDLLAGWGATNIRIMHTSGHPRIVFEWRGVDRFYVIPGTPSDHRAAKNAASNLRHMLGLVRATKRVGERRQRRSKAASVQMEPVQVSVMPDWHPSLRAHALYQAALRVALDEAWLALWRSCMNGRSRI